MDKIQLQNRTKIFAIRVFKMLEKLPKSKGADVILISSLKHLVLLLLTIEQFVEPNQKQILLTN